MSETNSRGRDRVPAAFSGMAELVESGQKFSFKTVDFSVMGLLFKADGAAPEVGEKVRLNFILPGEDNQVTSIMLSAEVVRVIKKDEGPMYGVQWLEQENAQNIETLETYYTELFFDMID